MPCDVIVDSYSEANKDNQSKLYANMPNSGGCKGQCFITPEYPRYAICKAKFYLQRVGNPDGVLKARLYTVKDGTVCGGSPQGCIDGTPATAPYLAESNGVNMADVEVGYTLITFTFPEEEQCCMEANTGYFIVLVVSGCTTCDSSTDYVNVGTDYSSPTHVGTSIDKSVGWDCNDEDDICFYVYGEECGPCSTIIDSYTDENTLAYDDIRHVHPTEESDGSGVSQSFTTPEGQRYVICKVKWYLCKFGNPQGHLIARLYKLGHCWTGLDMPSDNVLASSNLVDMSTLVACNPSPQIYAYVTFTFPEPYYCMEANTKYVITVEACDATQLDADNKINVGMDLGGTYAGHNESEYKGGDWDNCCSNCDCEFYVYGEECEEEEPEPEEEPKEEKREPQIKKPRPWTHTYPFKHVSPLQSKVSS